MNARGCGTAMYADRPSTRARPIDAPGEPGVISAGLAQFHVQAELLLEHRPEPHQAHTDPVATYPCNPKFSLDVAIIGTSSSGWMNSSLKQG